jgi:hypothetical protein
MGIATFPAASSGLTSAIKSLQRGVASGAGNITITAVVTSKTICNSFSTSSTGTVAATGTISAANGTASATSTSTQSLALPVGMSNTLSNNSHNQQQTGTATQQTCNWNNQQIFFTNNTGSLGAQNIGAQNVAMNSTSISGGSTSLTAAVYGVYLVDSTTITATGPCRYEVIEYF